MSSTYLKLTNDLLDRFNEVNLTSSSFSDARGVHSVAKQYINNALSRVNTEHYMWPWNASDGEQVLTAGQELYSFPTDLKTVDMNSFYIEKDTSLNVNTTPLKEITQEEWYRYFRGADLDSGSTGLWVPERVFRYHGNKFGVTVSPDKAYTVKYAYYTEFTPLVNYDDQTTIYPQYDDVIVDLAEPYMWRFRTNPDQAQISEVYAKKRLDDLRKILINDEFKVTVAQRDRRGIRV